MIYKPDCKYRNRWGYCYHTKEVCHECNTPKVESRKPRATNNARAKCPRCGKDIIIAVTSPVA